MQGLEQALVEIVDGVWQSIFGEAVVEEDPFRLGLVKDQTLTGLVKISGGWDGYLGLQCSEAMARQSAATMLQIDPSAMDQRHVHDALGEVTNMIAGNFKALLPEL